MKNLHLSKGLVVLLAAALLWTSCQKEKSTTPQTELQSDITKQLVSGVVEDDAIAVSKVPLIVSSNFLAQNPGAEGYAFNAAKGKPVRNVDATVPLISITSPANGATVSGAINVSVNASDNVGVTSVSLSIDGGSVVSSSSVSPFTNTWNSATVTNGTHTLKVTASDASGNKSTNSIQVNVSNVTVGDITAPTVNYITPANQSSLTGTVTVSVSATDNVAVSSVSISIDDIVVSTSTSYSWNTSNSAAGGHILKAVAKDAAGNQGTSSISVTVNTTVVEPPSTSGVSLIMPPVGNQGGEGSCVAFAAGYAARSAEQFYKTGAGSYSNSINVFSPEFLYNQVKFSTDCGSGTSMQKALDLIVTKGISTFQSMPYSATNGCSLLPTTAQLAEALNYKINGYAKMINTDKAAIKSMVSQNHPVIATIIADNSFVNAKTGFIWKAFSGSGNLAHCIVICGYDDAKNAYKVMNSWGTTWGDAGYSWIDYDFFPTKAGTYCYVIN
ncbi:MAG: Ig-like domain-containing protein [Bacteroidota bacterium]